MKSGDYVLATKYNDGDPQDQWCVGFWAGHTPHKPRRHVVVDNLGAPFRGNGFRSASKITMTQGAYIMEHKSDIEQSDRSIWSWLEIAKQAERIDQQKGDDDEKL